LEIEKQGHGMRRLKVGDILTLCTPAWICHDGYQRHSHELRNSYDRALHLDLGEPRRKRGEADVKSGQIWQSAVETWR